MGSERASFRRMRESGRMCCACPTLLAPPAEPGYRPGPLTGERYCPRCERLHTSQLSATTPPPSLLQHHVRCNVTGHHDFSTTFKEILRARTASPQVATPDDTLESYGSSLGPWLLLDTVEEVDRILRWGHISAADLAQHHDSLRRWGVGGGRLRLSTRQRHQLIARGHGWPWNAYELRQMKRNGTYPPAPLSPSQEAAFLRQRTQRQNWKP